jgi:hypothetical protein
MANDTDMSSESEKIDTALKEFIQTVNRSRIHPAKDLSRQLLNGFNFMLISYRTWNKISKLNEEALQLMPSTLILSK